MQGEIKSTSLLKLNISKFHDDLNLVVGGVTTHPTIQTLIFNIETDTLPPDTLR